MKKIFIVYGIIIILVIILAIFKLRDFNFNFFNSQKNVTVGSQTFNVKVVNSEKDKKVGLSKTKSLPENGGMLFTFESKGYHSFWMKNMQFPIDIIFIDTDKVVDVKENAQPPADPNATDLPIYTPSAPADSVLEINAGLARKYNIKPGDTVTLP